MIETTFIRGKRKAHVLPTFIQTKNEGMKAGWKLVETGYTSFSRVEVYKEARIWLRKEEIES